MPHNTIRIESRVLQTLRSTKVHPRATDSETIEELLKKTGIQIQKDEEAEKESEKEITLHPKSQESDEKAFDSENNTIQN